MPLILNSTNRNTSAQNGNAGFAASSYENSPDVVTLKFLREHLNNNRIKDAYELTVKQKTGEFDDVKNFELLKTVKTVFEAYQKNFSTEIDDTFFTKFAECLRGLLICHLATKNTNEVADILFQLDLLLLQATEFKCNKSWWNYYLQYLETELLSFCADLLLLLIKKGKISELKKNCRLAVYCYANCLKYDFSKCVKDVWWRKNSIFNLLQAHQMFTALKSVFDDEWPKVLESLNSNQVNKDFYRCLFPVKLTKNNAESFILLRLFQIVNPQGFLLPDDYVNEYYKEIVRSTAGLHFDYALWFLGHYWDEERFLVSRNDCVDVLFEKALNFAPIDLNSTNVQSLCQLDLKIFLNLSVHYAFVRNEKSKTSKLHRYSFRIVDFHSSIWQKKFWNASLTLVKEGGNADLRATISDGLNVIRLKSNNVPPARLIYGVASMLEILANEKKNSDVYHAVLDYASVYWRYLENNLLSGREIMPKSDSPFPVVTSALNDVEKQKVFNFNKSRSDVVVVEEKIASTPPKVVATPPPKANVASSTSRDQSSLLQSQEIMMKAVLEQNKTLAETCRSLTEQMQLLTLTNKELIEQMNEMRKENVELLQTTREKLTAIEQNQQSQVGASSSLYNQPQYYPTFQIQSHVDQQAQSMYHASQLPYYSGIQLTHPFTSSTPISQQYLFGMFDTTTNIPTSVSSSSASYTNVVPPSCSYPQPIAATSQPQQQTFQKETIFGGSLHAGGSEQVNPLFSTPTAKPRTETKRTESESQENADDSGSHAEHFEPTAEFKPLVPLPALVEAKTGEEDETILFKERAKLYRFDHETNEFKERGVGDLKILRHDTSGRLRVLMRREQVLKLCANHHVTADMQLRPMAKSTQAFTWHCQDFSDGELKPETLAARFKTVELAEKFKKVFEECVDKVKKNEAKSKNEMKMASSSTDVIKTDKVLPATGFGDAFKPAPGSWECKSCTLRNNLDKKVCAACGATKDGATPAETKSTMTTTNVAKTTEKTFPTTGFGDLFKPAPGSWECKSCMLRNNSDTTVCAACLTSKDGSLVSATKSTMTTTVSETKPAAVFGFGPLFGTSSTKSPIASTTTTRDVKSVAPPVFGIFDTNTKPVSFADLVKQGQQTTTLQKSEGFTGFPGTGQPLFGFDAVKPKPRTETKRTDSESHENADDSGSHAEHFEPTAEFKPLVPLPALIEVKTGEEDETALFKERAKLYRFDHETNEFKERGVGELKILRHNTSGRLRVLMRRDQVLKVCANHQINADMQLRPMAKSTQAFTWHCQDFSEGELKPETLAAKFKTPELAEKFKKVLEECVEKVKKTETESKKETKTTLSDVGKTEKVLPTTTGFGDLFKPAPGSWECKTCMLRNNSDKKVCSACGSAKDGATAAETKSTVTTFATGTDAKTAPVFGFGSLFGTSATKPAVGLTTTMSPPAGHVFGSFDTSAKPPVSFADLVKQGQTSSFQKSEGFTGFPGSGQPLFGFDATKPKPRTETKRTDSESHENADDSGSHAEHFEPTAEFKPLIPLPALVEAKTGEEDETILFKERAKLYRFDHETNEFKERGLGDLKILRHNTSGRLRVLMRREQILKICANHQISADMQLRPMSKSTQAFTWHCQDFSDGELKPETLAAKFKTAELAEKFKKVFEECVDSLKNPGEPKKETKTSTPSVVKTEIVSPPTGFGFKTPAFGSLESKPSVLRENSEKKSPITFSFVPKTPPKETVPLASTSTDVQIVFEAKASPEQRALAEKYKLPPNFYLYETKSPCPGCVGCKKDDEIDTVFKEIERRASSGASGSLVGDENGDDGSSEEGKILFSKNATLSTKEGDAWKPLGVGEILIVYDDDVDAYRCRFNNLDSAAVLMNHLIAQPCELTTQAGKRMSGKFMAEWAAPDWADNPSSSIKKSFQLKFSSALALKEFTDLFKQGLEIARKNQIFYDMPSEYPFNAMAGSKHSIVCQEPSKTNEEYDKKEEE